MRNSIAITALVLTCFAVTPSKAQTVGVAVESPLITMDGARDIALVNGVVAIHKIEFDEGLWKIYGRDVSGRRVEMKVDPRSGQIAELERFD
jgi:hypothetical protein